MWAKVCNHAKTTPPRHLYALCRCPIQPSVRNLIVYSTVYIKQDFAPTLILLQCIVSAMGYYVCH